MARSRSSGGGRSRSSGRSTSVKNPPKKVDSTPPPAHHQGNGGSFLSTIADGMGWGAGRAMGERVVGSIFGPSVVRHEAAAPSAPAVATPVAAPNSNSFVIPEACSVQNKTFIDCLYASASDISKCQFYMDKLQQCRRGSDAGMNV